MTTIANLNIPARFNGPDNSANGGYACGLVATQVDYPVRVRLHWPPPLDKPLSLHQDTEQKLQLLHEDRLIASAQPYEFQLTVPEPIEIAEAEIASKKYVGFHAENPFTGCFVCGTTRPKKDGMKVYAGRYEADKVAAPWFPAAEFSSNSKTVDELFLWAALDCPGAYSIPNKGHQPVVLGQMATQFFQPVVIEQPHIITGWTIEVDGRKVKAGTAMFTADKELCAVAEQTWIILK